MRTMCGTVLAAAVALAYPPSEASARGGSMRGARADRIDDMMTKMTLREKIGQCVQVELAKIPLGSEEEAAAWFAKYPIGSVFMGKDLASLTEGEIGNAESLARCAAATKIPLTVAGDLGPVIAPAAMPGNGAMRAAKDLFQST